MRRFDQMRTRRLLLRRWREQDHGPFAAMNADPVVMRHFPAPLTPVQTEAWVTQLERRFDDQGFGLWVLERQTDGAFLGFTGLNPLAPGPPGGGGMEVGWRLAEHAWGHGYATEAARAALQVGLVEVGLPEIWSHTAAANVASQAVMQRIGCLSTPGSSTRGCPRATLCVPTWPIESTGVVYPGLIEPA